MSRSLILQSITAQRSTCTRLFVGMQVTESRMVHTLGDPTRRHSLVPHPRSVKGGIELIQVWPFLGRNRGANTTKPVR